MKVRVSGQAWGTGQGPGLYLAETAVGGLAAQFWPAKGVN